MSNFNESTATKEDKNSVKGRLIHVKVNPYLSK